MATLFTMPKLGNSMEEGTVLQWFKQEGDAVKKGDPLLEVMSDKANFEVEAENEGILRKVLAKADDTVPVGGPLAVFGSADENIDAFLAGGSASAPEAAPAPAASAPAPAVSAPSPAPVAAAAPTGKVDISPRALRIAGEMGISPAELAGKGTGPGGRVIERDVEAYAEARSAAERVRVTPLAAKIAEDLGVKVEELAGALPGGRVTADAVRAAAAPAPEPAPAPAAPAAPAAAGGPIVASVIPFKGMRKMVADTVTRSRQTAPHIHIQMEVDMSQAVALQPQLVATVQKTYSTKLTYTDVLIKAVARTLPNHPLCNAALIGDEIRLYQSVNLGIAVATDTGLVVPVIRDADKKALGAVSVELKELVERCRTGKQTAEDLADGTFTITNLGAFGVDAFDPILVPPQSCILGVCRIAPKPVAVDGEVAVRPMMNLCLSIDHRVLDGVPAARFLKDLKELLENPLGILV